LACLLTWALPTWSASTPPGNPAAVQTFTLADLCSELKRDNPQLLQARQAYLAAKLAVPIAGALPAPQFSLLEQANTGGPFDFNRNSGFYAYYNFTQPFLWFGKRDLAAAVARAQAEVVGRQYDALELQLVSQLKLGFYTLMALQDQLRFMDEDLQRLQQIKEASKVRYANNAAAYVDFLNAQVSAGSLENDRFALQKQIQAAKEQISNLLGRSSQAPLEVRDQDGNPHLPAAPLDQLIELAQKTNPAIAGGESQIEAADKSVALAHKAFWPDFQLSAGSYADPSVVQLQTMRMYSVGVVFNLPTWGFRKEQAGLEQAKAQLDEARSSQQASLQQVDLAVAGAYHALETAQKQIEFTRERLLPQAQMAYRLALSGYGSGGATAFSDLLLAQSGLRNTELALVQAENTALQAYVSLAAAIGKDPE
jgi:cobalt-zinc-cadmium efflux system outer membrane protein